MNNLCAFILIGYIFIFVQCEQCKNIVKFSKITTIATEQERNAFNNIPTDEWIRFIKHGYNSVIQQKRFEHILSNSHITVENGSISHIQLLDILPDAETQIDSDIASIILTTSLHIYNTKCYELGIESSHCAAVLANKRLPAENELLQKCMNVVSERNGRHTFRRLLPRKYQDDFYKLDQMLEQKSPPLDISQVMLEEDELRNAGPIVDDNRSNLALVQWTQFIEHDLSRPVVPSMSSGKPIECCHRENYNLLPRYRHLACMPLLRKDPDNIYATETCLNYVRSAVGTNGKCTFGPADQLNQATGVLDLSQLYGYTPKIEQMMRSFVDGQIKSSKTDSDDQKNAMLPHILTNELIHFCAWTTNNSRPNCFIAGDSRVNNNPLSIAIYTLFLRNHNRLATKLKRLHPNWNDELLFNTAKTANIHVYRGIVMDEWFPAVFGFTLNERKVCTSNRTDQQKFSKRDGFQISNEFAVAAIRFYYSMMPDFLEMSTVNNETKAIDLLSLSNFLVLKDPIYKSNLDFTPHSLNVIQQSLLKQNAMMRDSSYEPAFVLRRNRTNHLLNMDTLAFDIQRGRDHGLQGYKKYAEICNNIKIEDWKDLKTLIAKKDIDKLRKAYNDVNDVDLIVGGISEISSNGSVVGPTFSCILAEQFLKIREWQLEFQTEQLEILDISMNFSDLICTNYDISKVPENIFRVPSKKNGLISCDKAMGQH